MIRLHAEELKPYPEPSIVARQLAHLPHLLFLDSAEVHAERGRYSYIMAAPSAWYTQPSLALSEMRKQLAEQKPLRPTLPGLPPFQGGFAGLFSYGFGRQFEQIPHSRFDEFAVDDLAIGRYDWVIAFDHLQATAWLIAPEDLLNSAELRAVRQGLVTAQMELPKVVQYPPVSLLAPSCSLRGFANVQSNFDRAGYVAAVRRAVEYVHAGDVFQVNLSQRLLTPLREHPLELYSRLRVRNPAPFSCYFDAGAFQIVSSSPERFLLADATGHVSTKPIKGTRPRGKTPEADAELLHDLQTSAKDRAENVMIVDLLRNDLGRVCEYGSVCVPRICEVESYRYVHHLVSEVCGKLAPNRSSLDLLCASFPGGSVTGAPKVRAMEIIAELEPTARGPYCGSIGFLGYDGAMDTNILIRTFTAAKGWLQFPVGGGIVADSLPETEYEETLHKAAGLLRALDVG